MIVSPFGKDGPARGDVVVTMSPDESGFYLKRVVGMPGETVAILEGMFLIDGEPFSEPYLHGLPASVGLSASEWKLGENEFFLMGDNRAHSDDSRKYGPVNLSNIKGRAILRCWPLRGLGRMS